MGRPFLTPPRNLTESGESQMARKLISSGSKFETEMAYSRAVVDGDWIFVSGTTGFNYATMEISDDVAAQAEQTFLNIKAAMEKAGFGLEHIVRVHYILPKAEEFQACWPVLRKFLGDIRPAATMFVAVLVDPRMKIEIEVTGKKSGPA
jgi:enamine deaminase RidA (YjgF/YER057c/UK114 family)